MSKGVATIPQTPQMRYVQKTESATPERVTFERKLFERTIYPLPPPPPVTDQLQRLCCPPAQSTVSPLPRLLSGG